MTLLDDLERFSEKAAELSDEKGFLNVLLPDWWDPDVEASHPGSTKEPPRMIFLSEAFVA